MDPVPEAVSVAHAAELQLELATQRARARQELDGRVAEHRAGHGDGVRRDAARARHGERVVDRRGRDPARDLVARDDERAAYLGLRSNAWGQKVRLEQERLPWDVAIHALRSAAQV